MSFDPDGKFKGYYKPEYYRMRESDRREMLRREEKNRRDIEDWNLYMEGLRRIDDNEMFEN